jgi:hypothetical protein
MTQMNGRKLNRKERRMFASNKFKAKQERKQMNAKEVKPIRHPDVVFKEYGNACAAYGDAKLRESMIGVEINQLWNKMIELRDEHQASVAAQPKAATPAAQPEVKSEESQSVPS